LAADPPSAPAAGGTPARQRLQRLRTGLRETGAPEAPARALRLAHAWAANEQARLSLAAAAAFPADPADPAIAPDPATAAGAGAEAQRLLRRARVQTHYLAHDCFVDLPRVLAALHGWARHKPLALVHGAADGLCPADHAERVRQALAAAPDALWRVPDIGHDAFAAPMLSAWGEALERVRGALGSMGA
ncbi:MAG: hypothetical protein QM617_14840, partial [Comamonas sp.]